VSDECDQECMHLDESKSPPDATPGASGEGNEVTVNADRQFGLFIHAKPSFRSKFVSVRSPYIFVRVVSDRRDGYRGPCRYV